MSADGLLLVDKPAGWTSHDVVARSRRLLGTRKVGHAGTLDPMATGVLVLGVGRATRLLTFLVGCDKAYAATVRLGQSTVTDDAEGDVVTALGARGISLEAVTRAAAGLTGEIDQVPSAVSAVKIDGQRAYHRVRAGEDVQLPARRVTVSRFAVLDVREVTVDGIPVLDVDIEVEVSSGTYVRALARDLGSALGCGGHLTALRRTRVGGYALADCAPWAALLDAPEPPTLLAMGAAARAAFPVHELTDSEVVDLRHGKRVTRAGGRDEGVVAGLAPDGDLVAILDESGPLAKSRVVFPPAAS